MIIEVTGTSVRNKGAELMLVAAREALGAGVAGYANRRISLFWFLR